MGTQTKGSIGLFLGRSISGYSSRLVLSLCLLLVLGFAGCQQLRGLKRKMESWVYKHSLSERRPATLASAPQGNLLEPRGECPEGMQPYDGDLPEGTPEGGSKSTNPWCVPIENKYMPYDQFKEHYPNGNPKVQMLLKDDKMQITRWYENGQTKETGHYIDYQKDGQWLKWAKNGVLIERGEYKESKKHGKFVFREQSGNLSAKGYYHRDVKTGLWTTFHKNGRVASRTQFVKNMKHGNSESFAPNGVRLTHGAYYRDHPNGRWITYHENGIIRNEGSYRLGKKDGRWVEYDTKGNTREVAYFKNGQTVQKPELIGSVKFDKGDTLGAPPPLSPRRAESPVKSKKRRWVPVDKSKGWKSL